jgi:kynureninase
MRKTSDQFLAVKGVRMPSIKLDQAVAIDESSAFQFPSDNFSLPTINDRSTDRSHAYLLGHSLGLKPAQADERVNEFMKSWGSRAIRGHWDGPDSWYRIDEKAIPALALLTGGKHEEVVLMNSLTINIHLMFTAFYRPEGERTKVLMEAGAFPSDRYAVETQIRTRDLVPDANLIQVKPRTDEHVLRTEDILEQIELHGDKIALVFLGAVQYTSGQVLDMKTITDAARAKGCNVGFDLAHATGNIELKLHEWGPDFAVGCGYKFLNAGAGNGAHAWIHQRHVRNPQLTHLGGWWSNDPDTRFEMRPSLEPQLTARRFACSNPPGASAAAALGGLDAVNLAASLNGGTLDKMWERREQLWNFLHEIVSEIHADMPTVFDIITPTAVGEHGAVLSLWIPGKAPAIEKALCDQGFVIDARGDSIIRISAVPYWTTAEQIFAFGNALRNVLAAEAVR